MSIEWLEARREQLCCWVTAQPQGPTKSGTEILSGEGMGHKNAVLCLPDSLPTLLQSFLVCHGPSTNHLQYRYGAPPDTEGDQCRVLPNTESDQCMGESWSGS